MPKRYKTCEEIKNAFVKDGWNKDISFEEVTIPEVDNLYGYYIREAFYKGRKFFRMVKTGNIFDDCGKIVYYNVPINNTH